MGDLLRTEGALERAAALAGSRGADASAWLDAHLPRLRRATRAYARTKPPHALLHMDARSDNLRVHPRSERPLRLFDWPYACAGPPEIDLAFLAVTITCEGGPERETLAAWYAETGRLRPDVLAGAVAAVAGYFADAARRPEVPELPRLRAWQRKQLGVSLRWASRLLALPEPTWVA